MILERLRSLFLSDDPGIRAQGVELLRTFDDAALFDAMLEGTAHATTALTNHDGQADVIVPGPYFHAVRLDQRKVLRAICWQVLASAPAQSAFAPLRDRMRVMELGPDDAGPSLDLGTLTLPASLRALYVFTHSPVTNLGALRRLASLETLVFAACSLPEGLDEIADMPGLRELVFRGANFGASKAPLTLPDLQSLRFERPFPASLLAGRLPSLRALTLFDLSDRDLRALGHLTGLRALDVVQTGPVVLLDGIESLTALERLKVNTNSLKTLAPLTALRALRTLRLDWISADCDVSAVAILPALREFHARNITPALASMLREVALEGFSCDGLERGVDLGFLGRSAALGTSLFLGQQTTLRTLAGLHPDAKVPSLTLKDAPELESIGALPAALRALSLQSAPRLHDLRGIEQARALESLTVNHALALTDLSPLAGLTQLKRLTLQGALALRDLSPLASLPALEELTLKGCEGIEDIRVLAGCPALKGVLLAGTSVDRRRVPRALQERCSWDQKVTMERVLERAVASPAAPVREVARAARVAVPTELRPKLAALAQQFIDATYEGIPERVRAFMADATPALWSAALSQWIAHPPTEKKPFGELTPRAGLSSEAAAHEATLGCLALLRYAPDTVAEKAALRDQIASLDLIASAADFALPALPKLARLRVTNYRASLDLDALAAPAALRALHLTFDPPIKPPSLKALTGLESLTFNGELSALPRDLAGRSALRQLTLRAHVDKPALDLTGCAALESLSLAGLHQKALPDWAELTSLKHLSLDAIRQLELDALGPLASLESLTLNEIARLRDLSVLSKLARLKRVVIRRCPFVEDLSPLVGLPDLESVTLAYATRRAIHAPPGLEGRLRVE